LQLDHDFNALALPRIATSLYLFDDLPFSLGEDCPTRDACLPRPDEAQNLCLTSVFFHGKIQSPPPLFLRVLYPMRGDLIPCPPEKLHDSITVCGRFVSDSTHFFPRTDVPHALFFFPCVSAIGSKRSVPSQETPLGPVLSPFFFGSLSLWPPNPSGRSPPRRFRFFLSHSSEFFFAKSLFRVLSFLFFNYLYLLLLIEPSLSSIEPHTI